MLIIDDSERLVAQYRNPLQDMFRIATSCWHNHRIRLRILVYAIGREMTHGIIWVYTPILLYAGVPLAVVSLAWAINSLFAICGSYLASHYAPRLHPWQILAIPLFIMSIAMGVLFRSRHCSGMDRSNSIYVDTERSSSCGANFSSFTCSRRRTISLCSGS